MDQHKNILKSLCRICGEKISRKSKTWKKERKESDVRACYDVNIHNDDDNIHPQHICNQCFSSMMKILAARKTKYHQPAREIQVVTWEPHCDDCKVCQEQSHGKRRRPKKIPGHGHQSGETINLIVAHVRDESGSQCAQNVSPERISSYSINSSHLTCPVCHHIVDGPIHLKCGQLACGQCIAQLLIEEGPDWQCPVCGACTEGEHFVKCSGVEVDIVQNVKVTCKHGCRLPIPLKELETHEQACDPSTTPTARHSMHDITIGMILETPLDDPFTPDEMVLCTHLVKRGMGGGTQLVLKTGGQV